MTALRSLLVVLLIAGCGSTAPAPVTAPPPAAAGGAPCLPGPPLVATTVHQQLERFSASVGTWDGRSPLPRGRFGACRVVDGKVIDPAGGVVADLGCGIGVRQRGIVDHLGLQIGDAGADVLAREPNAAARLVCMIGPRTDCWFRQPDDNGEPRATYTLTDPLPPPEGAPITVHGIDAVAVLRARRIERFHMTVYCH
jgi:hypothetical protein